MYYEEEIIDGVLCYRYGPNAEFKLIVAGGRDFRDYALLSNELNRLVHNDLAIYSVSIVSGMAPGADTLAVRYAKEHGMKLYGFYANWDKYKRAAGPIRNNEMAKVGDGLIVFWDGQSSGTKHMLETMRKQKKPVRVVRY